MLGYDAISIN